MEFPLRDGRTLRLFAIEPEDATEVVAYCNQVGGETDFLTFGANEFHFTVEAERAFLTAIKERQRDFMLKGCVDGAIVTVLSLLRTERPRLCHAADLGVSVREAFWGLGIGRRICEESLRIAKDLQMTKVNLRVREDNSRALSLYEKLGFVREGRVSRSQSVRGIYYADLLMGIEL